MCCTKTNELKTTFLIKTFLALYIDAPSDCCTFSLVNQDPETDPPCLICLSEMPSNSTLEAYKKLNEQTGHQHFVKCLLIFHAKERWGLVNGS